MNRDTREEAFGDDSKLITPNKESITGGVVFSAMCEQKRYLGLLLCVCPFCRTNAQTAPVQQTSFKKVVFY